ncbi:Hpt domain-containing protein [Hasllibacter halocynthiae]|uniref:Hpt domain-containing protein n=1 Tax=Hasllibacter halocynthiae TaxID=595589 RepID=A0A2T0X275_9RHOB|nr:Hpt domain-containing protein [Hasllibacter halocynthiae]PRY93052.1 Hpt domain-containing protein [Hasllibacter halocynthiae]
MPDEIDDGWILRLSEEIGAEAVDEVVAIFVEETREGVAHLRGGADAGEVLHSLSGAAANLGFSALERDARGAMLALSRGEEVPLAPLAGRFEEVCTALERRVAA